VTEPNIHAHWQSLVPDYLNGRLNEADSAALRAHVEECEECRTALNDASLLKKGLHLLAAEEQKRHPETGQLVAYVHGDQSLTASEREQIEVHLLLCKSCSATVAAVQNVADELAREGQARQRNSETNKGLSAHSVIGYALAASLLLLLGYPALQWYQGREPAVTPVGVETITMLVPQTRSALRPATVTRADRDETIALVVALDSTIEGPYQVTLHDQDGGVVWQSDGIAGFAANFLNVRFPGTTLEDGLYRLNLSTGDVADDPIERRSLEYSFLLKTSP
jgi:predicted anti-sigma-YlaC factor YlaD